MTDLHANVFEGYVSWRDTQAGSWYVENLDLVLEENVTTDDLVTMLMMVRLCPVKLLKTFKIHVIEAATDRCNKYVLKNGKNNKQTSIIMLPISVEQYVPFHSRISRIYNFFKGFNTMYELYTTLQNASHAVQNCV